MGKQELRCLARHPGAKNKEKYRGKVHGALLPVNLPFTVRWTGRILSDLRDVAPGRIGVMCVSRDCRAVMEYEMDPEADAEAGGGADE